MVKRGRKPISPSSFLLSPLLINYGFIYFNRYFTN